MPTKPDNKIEKLKEVLKLLKDGTITPTQIKQFLEVVLGFITKSKDEFEQLSAKNLRTINEAISYVESEHKTILEKLDSKSSKAQAAIEKKLAEAVSLVEKLKLIEPIDGKDGRDGKDANPEDVVPLVLEKLPKYEQETGESIVEKINDLPTDEDEFKIDFSHLKNVPDFKPKNTGGVVARNIYQLGDVNLTNLTDGQTLVWDDTNKYWKNATSGGTIDGSGTANELTYWVDSNTVGSLATATYPSLTELSYVKGVTSSIQDQIDNLTPVSFGTDNQIPFTNAAGDDFDYSSAFTFNGTTLSVDSAAVFNESGADVDFRIEGDTEQNLFFVDASTDRIGIGTATPSERLHIVTNVNGASVMQFSNTNAGTNAYAGVKLTSNGGDSYIYRTSATYGFGVTDSLVIQEAGGGSIVLYNGGDKLRIGSTSAVFNEEGTSYDVRIEGDTNINLFFADGSADSIGIGTNAPDRLFHAELTDAVTSAISYVARFTHVSTGTPATGFGVGIEFEAETATVGTNAVVAAFEFPFTDATATSEDTSFKLRLIKAGTLTDAVTVNSLGEATFAGDVTVPDEAYGAGWNGSLEVPTKNALYDKIESITAGTVPDADYGDVTVSSSGTVWTIDNDVVTYAKMQNVSATDRILGRITVGAGDVEELTAANVYTILGITSSAAELNILDGVTADAAELNILDGATLTTTELNFVDGVTSAIQTQLNGKASTTLNNLGTTAINAHLLFDTDAAYDIGSSTVGINDLHFGSGGVINFDGGDATITHTANQLTLAGASLALGSNSLALTGSISTTSARVTKGWFTDIESTNMPTVGGTAILTSLTAPQFTTIELGHASDTTLSRVSAGVVAIEGVNILTVAGGTLTGAINLGENAGIAYDGALSADGKYSGDTRTGTAGATLAFGDLVYLDPTDSRWELVDANAASGADGDARGIIGICVLAAAADGDPTTILLRGFVRADTAFPSMTINAPMYASETAGDITGTQPTTTDAVIRVVGFAYTADELYFNPSSDYITHT